MPNFLVIGAAKSGTEALCNYLAQHPDVYMCPHREPMFFEAEGRPEVPYRGPGDVAWLAPEMWTSSRAAYEALFADATETAIGEGTASYLYSEDAPARIRRYIPDTAADRDLAEPGRSGVLGVLDDARHGTRADEPLRRRVGGRR